MNRITDVASLRQAVSSARSAGRRIGLVPTMGYLHEGHLTLCDVVRQHADFIVMSIFVNPLQFGPGEDLARYPRDLQRDAGLAAARGVDIVFAPDAATMYPHGNARVRVHAPTLTDRLCGRFRPGHFEGVLTVVAKLFNIVLPDAAVFGQKDLQQAVLVRRMAQDLDIPVEIVVGPIVREADGLAMSSRNIYLDGAQRQAATALHGGLMAAQRAFEAGVTSVDELLRAAREPLDAAEGVTPQYVELVDLETLDVPERARTGDAVAVAAFVGATRLIDNHVLT